MTNNKRINESRGIKQMKKLLKILCKLGLNLFIVYFIIEIEKGILIKLFM